MGIQQLLDETHDSLAVIAYHVSDTYSTMEGTARKLYYGVSGVPDMWFDGGAFRELGGLPYPGSMYSYYRSDFNRRKTVASPLDIALSGSYDLGSRTGSVTAHIVSTGSSTLTGVVHFVLTEGPIYQVWQHLDSLYSVCRDMLPDAPGDTITLNPGGSTDETETFALQPTWNADHCEIVVFVQQVSGGKDVYQAGKIEVSELSGFRPIILSLNCLTPTVPRRGTLSYEYTFTNTTPQSQTFLYWTKVKLPNQTWRDAASPATFTLGPSGTLTDTMSHVVPRKAPLGSYEYWGYVGPDTTTIWSSQMFNFSVTKTQGDD